jgi:hypothetical protein
MGNIEEPISLERSSEHRDRDVIASEHEFGSVPTVMVESGKLLSGLPRRVTQDAPRNLPFQTHPDTSPRFSRSIWSPAKSKRPPFVTRLIGSVGAASRTQALGSAGSTANLPPNRKITHMRNRKV